MSYQVLARKWRPKSFQEMMGQAHVLQALTNALDQDRLHHAYLFTGTRGVGKTTLARILAKCLNCDQGVSSTPCGHCGACSAIDAGRFADLIEVDAASRAKVEETRELMDNIQYAPSGGRYKVYLIDEIHMFSKHSFNALLKTLEEPPPHAKFLLATTEPKKIPVTILSRCLQFNLSHLTHNQIAKQIEMILSQENIPFDAASVASIAHAAAGSMRDALSLLDQAIAYGGGVLEARQVCDMMGTIENTCFNDLIQALIDADPEALLSTVETIASQTPDFVVLLNEFLSLLQKIAIIQILPANSNNPITENTDLVNFAKVMRKEDVQLYYQIGMMGRRDIDLAPDLKSGFEMIMIRMLAFRPMADNEVADKTQTPKPVSNTNAQATPAMPAVAPSASSKPAIMPPDGEASSQQANGEWNKMIDAMALTGLLKELARNCVLKAQSANKIELALTPAQEHLLNQNQKDRLQQALQGHLGATIKLTIGIEDSRHETPAESNARREQERQAALTISVHNDPVVKAIVDEFDASVDQASIQATVIDN